MPMMNDMYAAIEVLNAVGVCDIVLCTEAEDWYLELAMNLGLFCLWTIPLIDCDRIEIRMNSSCPQLSQQKLQWQIQDIAEQVKERIGVSSFRGNADGGITMIFQYQFSDDSGTQMWRIYATGRNPTHVFDTIHDVILSLVDAENAKYKVSLTEPIRFVVQDAALDRALGITKKHGMVKVDGPHRATKTSSRIYTTPPRSEKVDPDSVMCQ